MPIVNCSPLGPKPQFVLTTGLPASGYKLFFYVAGSTSTKQNTYTDSTGTVANTNPLVMNTLGEPDTQIWLTAGQAYKVVLAPSTDTDPPTSPVWTIDNLRGINDTSVTIDQWVSGPAPTYIGATQFSLVGDQTSTFHVGRRIKATVTAGTVYGRISVSAFAAVTTITVVLDSGALDSGLSAVSYGLLSAINPSVPTLAANGGTLSQTSNLILGRRTAATGSVEELTDLQIGNACYNVSAAVGANALTVTLAAGQPIRWPDGTTTYTPTALTVTVPSGQAMGTSNSIPSRLWVGVMQNAGTPELAVINTQLGSGQIAPVTEAGAISTTAIAAAPSAGVWYSTTLRSTQTFALVGYVESTQATAGTWATSPSKVQGMGPGIRKPGDLIQTAYNYTGAVASGATTVPNDDTIPQITEANQFMTQAITPTSSINMLRIRHFGNYSNAGSAEATTVALFQDATANALAAQVYTGGPGGGGQYSPMALNWNMMAGTTSATTFRIRAGGTASTVTFNGQAAARRMGGVMASMLSVEEVMS